MSAFADVGLGNPTGTAAPFPFEAAYVFGRGNWVNATSDAAGALTLGNPYARRTPWYAQTDFNLQHSIKVNKNNEAQVLNFNATFTSLLNQHSPTSYWEGLNSNYFAAPLLPTGPCGASGASAPCSVFNGAAFYQAAETGYSVQQAATNGNVVLNSLYGQPNLWQIARHIRLGAVFTW